jgi:hypothetical protein
MALSVAVIVLFARSVAAADLNIALDCDGHLSRYTLSCERCDFVV